MRRAEYMVKVCDPKSLTVRQIMEDAVFLAVRKQPGQRREDRLEDCGTGKVRG